MSQQIKQLEDRISRLESDLKQLQQRMVHPVPAVVPVVVAEAQSEPKRGPGRPKKAE